MIDKTINVLKNGGLVVFPSDTVYGLLADATNHQAIKKLIEFKNRPVGKAISVFVSDFKMMDKYVCVRLSQKKLLNELLPGPFTIILPSKHQTDALLESEKKTLGVRIVKYDLINQLVKEYGRPLTATSANLAGNNPFYSTESLLNNLSDKKKELIDLIVDAGKLPRNKPSTVVDLTAPNIKILRQGDVSFGQTQLFISKSSQETKDIAKKIFKQSIKKVDGKPIFFILEGELGVGNTIFVKGLAEELKINNIISPTFVVSYEYLLENQSFKKFVHYDLYNIEDSSELDNLGINEYINKNNIIAFEWGEKMGDLFNKLKSKGKVIYIKLKYLNEKEREILVNYYI